MILIVSKKIWLEEHEGAPLIFHLQNHIWQSLWELDRI